MTQRVLVIGAGPAGMAVTAALEERGVRARLVDHTGQCGGAYRAMPESLLMASPVWFTQLTKDLPVFEDDRGPKREYVRAGEYRAYLDRFAKRHALSVERATVSEIDRESSSCWQAKLNTGAGEARAAFDAVIVATGMWSTPVWPSVEGVSGSSRDGMIVEHSKHFNGAKPDERVLVIGAGTSAVECAERACADGATVIVSARDARVRTVPKALFGHDLHEFTTAFERVPRWIALGFCRSRRTVLGTDQGFDALVRSGSVRVKGPVRSARDGSVVFEDGERCSVDRVVCATGYRYAIPFAPKSLAMVKGERDVVRTSAEGESESHRGLYFMGFPCGLAVASEFLRGIARDAPVVANAVVRKIAAR